MGRSAMQTSQRNVATSSPSLAVTDMWLGEHPHVSNGTPQRIQYLTGTNFLVPYRQEIVTS